MSPEEYVHQEIIAGRLTAAHIVELTRVFQGQASLSADGKPGPLTRAAIEKNLDAKASHATHAAPLVLAVPLPVLPDGRHAVMTSGFHTDNPSRPTHNGCDWFYHYQEGDQPSVVKDGGAASRDPKTGKPRWVVPYGTPAVAAADGIVQIAGNSKTGYRCWIDHRNGWRTGYFHLMRLDVAVGQEVFKGQPLGLIGDNPVDGDARHLHFELSPVDRYAPVDPMPYVK